MRTSGLHRSALFAALLAVAPMAVSDAQTYVAFGDSITEGVGDSRALGPNSGYPARLQSMLTGAIVRNRGLSGERTTEGISRIDSVLAEGGDALLLMEGTNDISKRIPLETTLFNLSEMARKASVAGMTTIHATVIPRLPDARVDFYNIFNDHLNESIRDLAGAADRDLVDNYEVYSNLQQLYSRFYWSDPEDPVGHPNSQGYDVMAETFEAVLEGRDTTPPVPGLPSPRYGDSQVRTDSAIEVGLWDFGVGIDLFRTYLIVDGFTVNVAPTGDSRHAILRYQPPTPLEGLVRVRVQTRDLASPPNEFDREVILFTAGATDFLDGDFDFSGTVDDSDLSRLISAYGTQRGDESWDPAADVNGDGIVDGFDLALLADDYGKSI